MYELIILGFLTRGPAHGYLMTKIINDMIGPFAQISHGRLYPLLAKLEASGGIVAATDDTVTHNDRRQHTFALTDVGRERFHIVMMNTTANPGDYRTVFWHKVPFMDCIRPDERLFLIDHYLHYCQAHIFHLAHEMDDLTRQNAQQHWLADEQLARTITVFHDFRANWQCEVEQARRLRLSEVERISQSEYALDVPTPEDARD